MKNFRIGLTAVVAVAAMSFTVASKDGILGKVKVSDGCYTTVTIDQTPPADPITYTSSQSLHNPASGDPKPRTSTIDVPNPSSPVSGVGTSKPLYKSSDCPNPYNNFCCFEVISNAVNTIYYRS